VTNLLIFQLMFNGHFCDIPLLLGETTEHSTQLERLRCNRQKRQTQRQRRVLAPLSLSQKG
jgi:hypothetical protein